MTNLYIGKNAKENLFKEIEETIKNNESLLISNNDETYYNKYKKILEDNNYNVFVLNLNDSSRSNSFNPLLLPYNLYKTGNKDKAVELITNFAREIVKEDNPNLDPFWENSAVDYITTLTLILFREGKVEEINLGSIQAMFTLAERKIDEISVIRKYMDNLDVLDSIYIAGSSIIYAPADTRGSIMSVAKQKLNTYCIREMLLNNLCNNDINLSDKTAIFIINNKSLNRIGNILINQVFESGKKFTYFLDKFSDSSNLLELDNIIDNDTLHIVFNSEEEFTSKYGKLMINKIDNNIKLPNLEEVLTNKEELPISVKKENQYFNIEAFVKNNIK